MAKSSFLDSSSEEQKVFTVSEITSEIQEVVEDFPPFWLVGEVSNLSRPRSGHIYFTLKDKEAQIGAVMWRSVVLRTRFEVRNGQEMVVYGRLSLYPPHGKYQIVVDRIQPKGVGALQLAFKQLQEKLLKEGLFADEHKRPIPYLPRRIGIVTSQSGAAIKDILTVLKRRFPAVEALLCHVSVQGEGASAEVAGAIETLNRIGGFDVLIVGRGGGSMEDLWAFNEEIVARAIFASEIPIISAVGHETDVTIADLVADRRALTPTEAAELAVPVRDELVHKVTHLQNSMHSSLVNRLREARLRLKSSAESYALRQPIELVMQKQQRLDELTERIALAMHRKVQSQQDRWRRMADVLDTLSPLKVLGRGYSITLSAEGDGVLREADQAVPGAAIRTILQSGEILSRVESVQNTSSIEKPDSSG